MLTTLGGIPTMIRTLKARPVFRARWLGPRPRKNRDSPLHISPPDWMTAGLCRKLPPESSDALFFGVENREAPGALIAAANQARKICARCPVEATCLANALVNDERYGVWGGTSGRQRSKLRLRLIAGTDVDVLVAECLGNDKVNA